MHARTKQFLILVPCSTLAALYLHMPKDRKTILYIYIILCIRYTFASMADMRSTYMHARIHLADNVRICRPSAVLLSSGYIDTHSQSWLILSHLESTWLKMVYSYSFTSHNCNLVKTFCHYLIMASFDGPAVGYSRHTRMPRNQSTANQQTFHGNQMQQRSMGPGEG